MAENVRPPVAIRIVRPFETEDELLENELETIGKTSVVLIGAHPRPTGVILRFEVTLASGATVLRGEGRVLAHKENAFRGQPGLTLRFTRLDPRSKSVVDRATALREQRGASDRGTPSRPPPPPPDGAVAEALTAATPAPAPTTSAADANEEQAAAVESALSIAREKANATARANAKRTGRNIELTPPPVPVEAAHIEAPVEDAPTPAPTPVTSIPGEVQALPIDGVTVPPPVTAPTISAPPIRSSRGAASSKRMPVATPSKPPPAASHIEPPPDRADLLARLRERAGKLAPERVAEILASKR